MSAHIVIRQNFLGISLAKNSDLRFVLHVLSLTKLLDHQDVQQHFQNMLVYLGILNTVSQRLICLFDRLFGSQRGVIEIAFPPFPVLNKSRVIRLKRKNDLVHLLGVIVVVLLDPVKSQL